MRKYSISILLSIFIASMASAADYGFYLVQQMGRSINLGNTLEAPFEGWWDIPAQEYMIEDYADAGFTCVRIPTRWDEHTADVSPYTIDASWLARVEEVVDWALDRGLYVVLNAHHENWLTGDFSTENQERFDRIWEQVSYHFRNKSDKLLFEIINEPYFDLSVAEMDALNERILDIIRVENATRYVLITGGSDVWYIQPLFQMAVPDDPYLIGYFHYYPPDGLYDFGWGSDSDKADVDEYFDEIQEWSFQNNIPIFLGEFGATTSADPDSRLEWDSYIAEAAVNRGYAFALWEHEGNFEIYHQETWERTWNEPILNGLMTSGTWPNLYVPHYPVPANGAVEQLLSGITLSWDTALSDQGFPDPNVTGHYLYYRVNSDDLSGITPVFIDEPNGAPQQTASHALPETFAYDDVIYWMIEEQIISSEPNDSRNITGPTWRFDVLGTKPVIDQQPQDKAADVGDTVVLTVQAHDPIGGVTLEYQLYQSSTPGDTAIPAGSRTTNPNLSVLIEHKSDLDLDYWCRIYRNSSYTDSETAQVHSKQLTAYWKMDALAGGGPEVIDTTGNGYDGGNAGTGSVSVIVGKIDNAYHFDEGEYILIDERTLSRPHHFTLAAWIRIEPTHDDAETICMWKETTGEEAFLLVSPSHQLEYVQETPGWEGIGTWWDAPPLNTGLWHHVAVTFYYQTARLYIDGFSKWSGTIDDYNDWGINDCYFYMGRAGYGANAAFEGDMDDLRLYNYEMTSTEIQAIYTQAQPYCFAEYDLAGDDCQVTIEDLAVFASDWMQTFGYVLSDLADFSQEWQQDLLGTPAH